MIKLAAMVLLVVLAVPLGWTLLYPTYTFRYRLTLEVETPEGVKRGSSVVEVSETKQPKIGDAPSSKMSIRGEAVMVDLGSRGLLFCLLKGVDESEPDTLVYTTFPPPKGSYATAPENLRRYARATETADLPTGRIPLLVRFRDIADPKTVERIDPQNLAAPLGPGVRLARATLELTSDTVTTGIEKRLPWLAKFEGGYLHGGSTSREAPLGLHGGNFQRGF